MPALLGWWVASSDPKRIKAVKVRKKGCSWGITINFHCAEGTFILFILRRKAHSYIFILRRRRIALIQMIFYFYHGGIFNKKRINASPNGLVGLPHASPKRIKVVKKPLLKLLFILLLSFLLSPFSE
jgi:hypothetical protein